jgi:hypothetical protein
MMDDERPRPRGATGSISEATGNKRGEEPKQLVLWSAARPTNNEADNARPPRALGQGAGSKFLLIEPIVTIADAASPRDHEIRAPRRDELTVSDPPAGAQWFHPALVIGALAVGLGLGWIGGSTSSRFFAPVAVSTPVQQADASGCAREGGKETGCAAAKSDREAMAGAPNTGKIAGPRARMVNRGHESSRGTQQASAAANRDVLTTNSIAPASIQDRAKILPRPTAAPETRPTTIEGWTIREVVGGTVVLEGPGGVWRATQGDTVPGVGRVDSIVRWGSRWIVATTKGLISTQD